MLLRGWLPRGRLLRGRLLRGALLALPLLFGALAIELVVAPPLAYAQANDVARDVVTAAYEQIRLRQYDDAIAGLEGAMQLCRKDGCQPDVKANVYLALGIAYGLKGDIDKARVRFEWALGEKPDAKADDRYTTRAVRGAFDAARKNIEQGTAAPPPRPVGKLTAEQKQSIETARQQLKAKDWEGCLQTMLVSTSIAE